MILFEQNRHINITRLRSAIILNQYMPNSSISLSYSIVIGEKSGPRQLSLKFDLVLLERIRLIKMKLILIN